MKNLCSYFVLAAAVLFLGVTSPCLCSEEEGSDKQSISEERIEQVMRFLREHEPERAEELNRLREESPEEFEKELRKVMLFLKPHTFQHQELSEERIKEVMNFLKEHEPGRAEKLDRLRRESPEKFEKELRDMIREHMQRRIREVNERGRGYRREDEKERGGFGGGRRPRESEREDFPRSSRARRRLSDSYEELLEWLDENFPEKAENLRKLKEEHPEHYRKAISYSLRKYRRVMEASEENPALAEVLMKDIELRDRRRELLGKIKEADAENKEELTAELREVISKRFDLIIKRKKIAYERLKKELEELKEEVKEGEKDIEKWVNMKDEKVEERLQALLGRVEKFDWD